MSSETFRGAKEVAASPEGSSALPGQQESWTSLGLPGFLTGSHSRWQETDDVYPTKARLPKGFNQSFESAPGSEPQITTRAAYLICRSQVPDFSLPAALPAESQLARVSFSQWLLET